MGCGDVGDAAVGGLLQEVVEVDDGAEEEGV